MHKQTYLKAFPAAYTPNYNIFVSNTYANNFIQQDRRVRHCEDNYEFLS